jgi:TM2 domain-containing membrane protein YozV
MNCANCGFGNADTARFCVRCGAALAAAATQRAAAPYASAPYPPAPAHGDVTHPYGAPTYAAHPSQPMMPTQRGHHHQPPQLQQAGGNPALAAILSVFIPGLGQLYNGDTKKGLVMFGGAVVGLLLLGLGWLAMMIWGGIDAWQVASGTGRRWD